LNLKYPHQPVLLEEVSRHLIQDPNGIYVDGTVGTGGHSQAIGRHLGDKGRLLCLDKDPEALKISRKRLAWMGERVFFRKADYADLNQVLLNRNLETVQGVLLDLGMSSYQLEGSGRGFSFQKDEPLDMRMDPENGLKARDLVNALALEELERTLKKFGEERRAKTIARAIVKVRREKPIETSLQLADIIVAAFPPSRHFSARHPATRTFQALRIAVNNELINLSTFLDIIPPLLTKGGRLVILAYHSLEDRMVKQKMVDWEKGCICPPDFPKCVCSNVPQFKRPFKKGIKPSRREIEENPRARSAILRVAERI
jgi:16S rRNA (cytosine1402-N4)-methyltransferase